MREPVIFARTDVQPSLRELSLGPRLKWTRLRQRMQDRGLFLLAIPDELMETLAWKIYIDQKIYQSPFSSFELEAFEKNDDGVHPANIDLTLLFQVENNIKQQHWSALTEQFHAFIICVSTREIRFKRSRYLQDNLIYQHRVLTSFPFVDVFKSCKHHINENRSLHEQMQETAWDLLLAWLHTIRSMKRHLPSNMSIEEQLFNFPDPITFKKQLPSSQYLVILLQYMCIEILGFGNQRLLTRYLNNAHHLVRTSVADSEQMIRTAFDKGLDKGHNFEQAKEHEAIQKLKDLFFGVIEDDLSMLIFQEVIEDESKLNLKSLFSDEMVEQLFSKKSDWLLWLEFLKISHLRDRMAYSSSQERSSIWPDLPELLINLNHLRLDQSPESLIVFRAAAKTCLHEQEEVIDSFVKKKWQNQFIGLSKYLTLPYFQFTIKDQRLIPQWNLIRQNIGEQLLDERANWEAQIEENHRELQNKLKGNKKYPKRKKSKANVDLDATALDRIYQHNQSIDIRRAVRQQKKLEFGIFNDSRTDDDHSEIWLNEMLTIEDEIAPYILFVKQAFHSALPIRKYVEVNHDRNSSDGIDFDPESIQDSQKWMHGEIMTTLMTKTKRSKAAQINAFVLDASGSMDHRRMRNLFKMLVLMVMGLEDRRSFDSFHFFNYNFIEGAKFSEEYTNRTLLFKILKRIARVEDGKVAYAGIGGTNMGEGIIECHDRIQAFHKYLQEQHPGMVFLKSIFVITDGQPSVGITDPKKLNEEINQRRGKDEIAIKGIYLKPPKEKKHQSFMPEIFGDGNFVESKNFTTAINELVHIMAGTYKKQRQNLKYQKTHIK